MRDIGVKQDNVGDTLSAGDFNALNNELENFVTSTDQSLDPAGGPDSDLNMVGKGATMYASAATFYTDGGSANAYALSRSTNLKDPVSYLDGLAVEFVPAYSNTGACTINVANLGIKDLVGSNGDNLIADDIVAGELVKAAYLSGSDEFRLVEPNVQSVNGNADLLINGSFDVWSIATSQTSAGYGSDDMWTNTHSGSTKTHSRQAFTVGQTDVPYNPTYYSRTVVTTGSGSTDYVSKEQHVEDVAKSAGKTVTRTLWLKADASKNVAVEFVQNFGTGGSPSSDVTGIGVTTLALTTSWQQFTVTVALPSISGKTLGTNGNSYLGVNLWFEAGSSLNSRTNSLGNQSGTFDVAMCKLEFGRKATPINFVSIGDIKRACTRYCQVMEYVSTDTRFASGVVDSTTAAYACRSIPEMRDTPSVTTSGTFYVYDGTTNSAPSGLSVAGMANNMFSVHATGCSGLVVGRGAQLTGNSSTQDAKIILTAYL